METVLGKDTHQEGYSIFHVWGELNRKQISLFYATKDVRKLIGKYRRNKKVFVDPASTNLKKEYIVI